MSRFGGALARKLDFGELPTVVTSTGRGRVALRLAVRPRVPTGPEKYEQLERRRRIAQIRARHLLDRMELAE